MVRAVYGLANSKAVVRAVYGLDWQTVMVRAVYVWTGKQ